MGLRSTVVLDENFSVGSSFGASGTPSAVLVDRKGKIASDLAVGAPAVLSLAGVAPDPANNGSGGGPAVAAVPKVGEPAPSVKLPDLSGETVDLADFRGEKTLVAFWNPGCGFCQRMLDDLKDWEANPPEGAPRLLVVSTGTAEANEAMGLRSPVVLDQGFGVGSAFGASGTPSAVLVDEDGKVASELGVGAPAVLALAGASQTGA
jgi:peroxiredoxin